MPSTLSSSHSLVQTSKHYIMEHYNIVVPKKQKNVYQTPNKNRVCCYWCCHGFDQIPVGLPVKKVEIKERYTLSGIYCSWNCVLAENSTNDNNLKMVERSRYVFELAKRMHNVVPRRAPPRECLKMFGGPMSIEQFRETDPNTTYVTERPPILEIIPDETRILARVFTKAAKMRHSSTNNNNNSNNNTSTSTIDKGSDYNSSTYTIKKQKKKRKNNSLKRMGIILSNNNNHNNHNNHSHSRKKHRINTAIKS